MARKALTALPVKLALLLLLAGIPAIALRLFAAAGERERLMAAFNPAGGPTEPASALAEALAAVDRNLYRDLLILGASAFLFAVVAGIISYFILRRPLIALGKQAKDISTGSAAPIAGKPYTGELGALAGELDTLRGVLAERTAQLRHEADRYSALLEGLPEVVYLYNADAEDQENKSYINGQIEALTGYKPDEWLADPKLWSRSLHEGDSERVLSDYERSCKTGAPFDCEYRITTKEGKVCWVHDRATVAADAEGKVSLMRGTMLDITERKEEHEKLSTRFGRLEAVLDAAGDATVGLDHHHTIVLFNAAAERLFRMERADVLGQHVTTLFEDDPYIAPKI